MDDGRSEDLDGAAGDQFGAKRYLKHYTIKLDSARKLKSVRLPKSADMRIVAITLEKSGS